MIKGVNNMVIWFAILFGTLGLAGVGYAQRKLKVSN
jgi:hypothetical protein